MNDLDPTPLDYAHTPSPRVGSRLNASFNFFIFLRSAMMLFVVTMIVLFVVPHFEQTFKDFKTELPLPTRILVAAGSLYRGLFLWIPAIAIPIVLGFVTAGKGRNHWSVWLVWVAFALLVIFVVLALFAPMASLIQTVSNPKH